MKKPYSIRNKVIKIFLICFIIGLIISIIYISNMNKNDLSNIIYNIKENKIFFYTNNNLIDHLKLLSIITLFSLIYIGLPIFIGLLISEGFSISIKFILLYKIYRIKGIFYAVLYLIINNIFYLLTLYFIFKKIVKIIKILYRHKIKQENINYYQIYSSLIRIIVLIIINFIYDYILYLYGYNILNL